MNYYPLQAWWLLRLSKSSKFDYIYRPSRSKLRSILRSHSICRWQIVCEIGGRIKIPETWLMTRHSFASVIGYCLTLRTMESCASNSSHHVISSHTISELRIWIPYENRMLNVWLMLYNPFSFVPSILGYFSRLKMTSLMMIYTQFAISTAYNVSSRSYTICMCRKQWAIAHKYMTSVGMR